MTPDQSVLQYFGSFFFFFFFVFLVTIVCQWWSVVSFSDGSMLKVVLPGLLLVSPQMIGQGQGCAFNFFCLRVCSQEPLRGSRFKTRHICVMRAYFVLFCHYTMKHMKHNVLSNVCEQRRTNGRQKDGYATVKRCACRCSVQTYTPINQTKEREVCKTLDIIYHKRLNHEEYFGTHTTGVVPWNQIALISARMTFKKYINGIAEKRSQFCTRQINTR